MAQPRCKVALFSGCVQDFVYPEQLEAGLRLLSAHGIDVDFPMEQSCCGLPVAMMGENKAARDVARQNVAAIDPDRFDYIVTLCASCASHLRHAYPRLLGDEPDVGPKAEAFAAKVQPLSVLLHHILAIDNAAFSAGGETTTYHAPCHLCRGMDEHTAPKALMATAGYGFIPAAEEETCCGFGGSYSAKFPEISAEILTTKLSDIEATGARLLVTECPGCVMQLRGGAKQRGMKIRVAHLAEALAERLKV